MPRTTADVPPGAASEFKQAPTPTAISDAEATGYTRTVPLPRGGRVPGKPSKQYGLPKSGKGIKSVKMKG